MKTSVVPHWPSRSRDKWRWSEGNGARVITKPLFSINRPYVRKRLHVAQLRLNTVLPLNADCRRAGRAWCRLRQRWTVARWFNVIFSDEPKFLFRFLWWGAKGLASNGGRFQPAAMIARPLWRSMCHGLWRNHYHREDRTPHLPEEGYWALLQRQCHWAYCWTLRPSAWECIHLSRRRCMSPSCTCCQRSPAVWQNHDSAIVNEVPRPIFNWTFVGPPRKTCPETASQPKGHQRAGWCTPGGMSSERPSKHFAVVKEHVVFRAWRRNEALLAMETSVKLIYWKSSSTLV